ncbi:MAG TPA: CBS domain-containing protein, partial [Sphingobacterium sp.]|nr:CBS domain-containing protein [Sphingobacterium sp.]
MFIGQYISTNYQVLPSDSVNYVLGKMDEFHCAHLPVVQQDTYRGLVAYEDLLEQGETNLAIDSFAHRFLPIYLFDYQHIYDALQLISAQGYGLVPVLDKQLEYLGVLTKQDTLVA